MSRKRCQARGLKPRRCQVTAENETSQPGASASSGAKTTAETKNAHTLAKGLPERFWAKVDKGDTQACWIWRGGSRGNGYGAVKVAGRTVDAHRVAYTLTHGPIPEGLVVMHSCDVRACCNPAHLSLGTYRENFMDAVTKGRRGARPSVVTPHVFGEQHGQAKLSEADALDVKRRHAEGYSYDELAIEHGVHRTTIVRICNGRRWAHLSQVAP